MGKNSWSNGRIIRAEESANLDANDSNRIFQITYDFGLDDDAGGNLVGGPNPPNDINTQDFFVSQPMIIHEYEVTVAATDLVMLHQYYGDSDQIYEWNVSNETFHRGLKQKVLIPGGGKSSSNKQYAVRTLKFDTDYIKGRKGRKGYWKNGLRPIVLSKNKGKRFGFTVSNVSGDNDAFFWAAIEIKRWSILD